MSNDKISDMLTQLRNAISVKHRFVIIPKTRMTLSITKVLKAEGYIESYAELQSPTLKTYLSPENQYLSPLKTWIQIFTYKIITEIADQTIEEKVITNLERDKPLPALLLTCFDETRREASRDAEGIVGILIGLKYSELKRDRKSILTTLKRVSKPGLRVYTGVNGLPSILGNFGIAIVSTSKGVMTNIQAKKLGVGGEILCYVW